MELDGPEFIARLQQGDRAAFGQLVKHHHGYLLATARSLLSPADAEEAVQDAWISAHRAIGKFEGRSQLRTWLTRIVINQRGGTRHDIGLALGRSIRLPTRLHT